MSDRHPHHDPAALAAAIGKLLQVRDVLERLGTCDSLPASPRDRIAQLGGRVRIECELLEAEAAGAVAGTRRGTPAT